MTQLKKLNLSEPPPWAYKPDSLCKHDHVVEKHFQQLKPFTVEATCRCYTCGLDWQEYYKFDYSDE